MSTLTDNEIRLNGLKTLVDGLGLIEAERFIALMNREGFDYSEWSKNMWEGMSLEEASSLAMSRFKPHKKN